jgi:hypothetical protein
VLLLAGKRVALEAAGDFCGSAASVNTPGLAGFLESSAMPTF